jgi:hypothetical protein
MKTKIDVSKFEAAHKDMLYKETRYKDANIKYYVELEALRSKLTKELRENRFKVRDGEHTIRLSYGFHARLTLRLAEVVDLEVVNVDNLEDILLDVEPENVIVEKLIPENDDIS